MLFDTHAHYDSRAFAQDREEVLARLPQQGISLVLCPGSSLDRSRFCVQLADQYDYIYAAVGIHPQNAATLRPSYLEELRPLLSHPKVKAVGEIGLDYYYDEGIPRPVQQAVFRQQMELAAEYQLPVIVHDRDAHQDCMRIIADYPTVRGVFHCYAGGVEQARELVRMGYMVSFTGTITFKNARKAPEVIADLPLSHIMLETDAPYMAPTPHRGQRNDSGFLYRMAETVAEIKGLPVEDVLRITTENGKQFFGITGE